LSSGSPPPMHNLAGKVLGVEGDLGGILSVQQ